MMTKNQYLFIALAVLIAVAAFFRFRTTEAPGIDSGDSSATTTEGSLLDSDASDPSTTNATDGASGGAGAFGVDGESQDVTLTDAEGNETTIKVTSVPSSSSGDRTAGVQIPSLTRPVVAPSGMSASSFASLKASIEEASAQLEQDPRNFDAWLSLGAYRKNIEDYDGALEAWEYASLLVPVDPTPMLNIANTQHYYMKQYVASESSFRRAIELTRPVPTTEAYTGLHELYRYSYTAKAHLADDVLLEGLALEPENLQLTVTLAAYYRDEGNRAKAREWYQAAIKIAEKANDQKTTTALKTELQSL